jgi:phosphoglycerate dehydrogenase-like enzyme
MVKVLCTLSFSQAQLDKLRAVSSRLVIVQQQCDNADEVMEALEEDSEVLYISSSIRLPHDLLSKAPKLRWLQLHGAGADHLLDHPSMRHDILITTTSGIHATPMAEYAFASMLAWNCQLPKLLYYQSQRQWPEGRPKILHHQSQKHLPQGNSAILVGQELRGSTLGIIGYGSTGREVGRIGKCFGMRVIATKRSTAELNDKGYWLSGTGDSEARMLDQVYAPDRLGEMLAECDYVVVSVPLTPETQRIISEEDLRRMKPNAYLVNISRGGIVDEPALIKALREGWIAGAGLDVFQEEPLPRDSPLYDLDNVILSPHLAGLSRHYDERASDLFAENLRRNLAGEALLNLVSKVKGY